MENHSSLTGRLAEEHETQCGKKNEPHLKLRRLHSNDACICSGALARAKRAAEHHGKKIW